MSNVFIDNTGGDNYNGMTKKIWGEDMSSDKVVSYIRRCAVMLPALPFICLGVSLWVVTGLGCDPFTSLHEGIARTLGLTVGTANLICNVSLLALFLILDRKMIGFSSVVMAFGLGPIIDLWCNLLRSILPAQQPFVLSLGLSVLGSIIVGLGVGFFVPLKVGYQPIDMSGMYLSKLIKKDFGFGMMIMNGIYLVAGIFLGATWGVATVFNLVAIGYIIQFGNKITGPIACKIAGIPFVDMNKSNV